MMKTNITKHTNTITTTRLLVYKKWTGLLLLITTAWLVACEDVGTGSSTPTPEEDTRTAITGTLSYADIIIPVGTAATSPLSITGALAEQEVKYTITRADGDTVLEGVSIDEVSGEITVAGTATKSTIDTYTISATGTGLYKGSIETTVDIWVQAFSYDTVAITDSSTVTQAPPTDQELSTSSFALKEQVTGLSIDANSGEITIDPTFLSLEGTYVITITEGTLEYDVAITIEDNRTAITGTLSYTDITIDVGASATETSTWDGATAGHTITYSITRTDGGTVLEGVSIDEVSGEITVSDATTKSTIDTYTVSAIGTGLYKGSIETTVYIWVQAFEYSQVNIGANPNDTITQSPPTGLPTSSFALKEEIAGLSVDASSGVVSIDTSTINPGTYVIRITEGILVYDVAIMIEDNRTAITGTVSYANITTDMGSSATENPTWNGATVGHTITYSITRADGGTVSEGISIDSSTGVITVSDSAIKSTLDMYTISVVGTGAYRGSIETTVDIWVKAFTYLLVDINSHTTITQSPPAGLPTSSFALKEQVTGLSVDVNSGVVSIEPSSISAGTYVIVITEGSLEYEVEITIEDNRTAITGTISYANIITDVGVGRIESPTWGGATVGQEIVYSVAQEDGSTVSEGISIDSSTGVITVSDTAIKSTLDTYIISVVGTGAYRGSIETTLDIWVKAFSYPLVDIYSNDTITQSPPVGLPTSSFALKEQVSGLSVDANSGVVSIEPSSITAGTYVIVITEGSLEYEVEIMIEDSRSDTDITGTVSYVNIITDMGSSSTENPTWSGATAGQTIAYNIARADGGTVSAGISIDSSTGAIRVSDSATKSTLDTYTISVIGTGLYKGTIEATVAIWVKAFEYSQVNIGANPNDTITQSPPVGLPTSSFMLKEQVSGLSIDANSGEVTIDTSTISSGTYVIAITEGSLEYEVEITIEDNRTAITGTVNYADIATDVGVSSTESPTWSGATVGQEITYNIARADGDTVSAGISIDSSTGVITVSDSATKSTLDTYTVSMTGTGLYKGSIETTVDIWVQAFSYDTVAITSTDSVTQNPPAGLPTSSFALKEEVSGLSIDANSGVVSIDPNNVIIGTYIIVITEGSLEYEVEITIEDSRSKTDITGTVSYADIATDVGVSSTESPTWSGATAGQTITYSIARIDGETLNGISIDSDTGVITVSNSATKSTLDTYKVSAIGIGLYKGTIETAVNIWVKAFYYDTVSITNSSTVTQDPPAGLPTSSFALKEETTGLSIDANSGEVTINPILLSTGDTYVITITEGAVTYEVEIEIVLPKPANKAALQTLVNNAISSKGNTVNLNYIDTSLVTDMSDMFKSKTSFNGDVSKWDVSNVTNMAYIFYSASAFSGDLSEWKVDKVTNMNSMFSGANLFNGDISRWKVGSVTNMAYMFSSTSTFNRDISGWKVSSVTNMAYMFFYAKAFNQRLEDWDVASSVIKTDMFRLSGVTHKPSWS